MQPFVKIEEIIAPLPLNNIDTDMIIPKQFLKTIKRTGLGANLFHEMRFDMDGKPINDFILNQDPYTKTGVLVVGDNFGCGSSREHAPWALMDFGIRSIIATSYADIFYNNCFKNGILPIVLTNEEVQEITEYSNQHKGAKIEIDLPEQQIILGNHQYKFDIEDFRKQTLIEGLDDIDLTLQYERDIHSFENTQKQSQPWLYTSA